MNGHFKTAKAFHLAPTICAGLLVLLISSVVFTQEVTTGSPERARGIELFHRGDFSAAVEVLNRLTKTDKTDGDAWYYLGLALMRENKISDARKAFETATRLHPNFGPGHTALSYVLMLTGKTTEAGKEARRAIELDSTLAEAHYVLGVVHLRDGEYEEAATEADLAAKHKPVFANAYLLKYQAQLARYTKQAMTPAPTIANTNEDLGRKRQARERSREIFRQATEALETFVKQSPESQTGIWREQLDTMQAFSRGEGNTILGGLDVSTKVRILSKPDPAYTSEALKAGVTGTVVLRAIFTSDGQVKHILVLASLPYGLTEAAIAAARKIKFVPATKDGKPMSMFMQLEYNFNM